MSRSARVSEKGFLLELKEDSRRAFVDFTGDGQTRPPATGSGHLVGRRGCRAIWQDVTFVRAVWVGW